MGGIGINRQVYDLALTVAFHAVKAFTAGAVIPLEVLVCQARPQARQPYEFFKAPVLFNQKQAGLVYSRAAMEARIVTANAQEHMRLTGAQGKPQAGGQPFTARVRHSLRPLLLLKRATMDEIAAAMNSSVRVLRRRLAGEGTTFADILDEVRYAMASELLQMTEMPLAEIADALSFAHPGTFSRAFRRWSGISPAQFRAGAPASGEDQPLRRMKKA
jgi:AraC-like DNA-binding protein